jgi:Na+/H+-dicarboxylate symporter
MNLLAEIASDNTGWADVFFLVAVIAAVLSAVGSFGTNTLTKYAGTLLSIAVAAAAFGWLVL